MSDSWDQRILKKLLERIENIKDGLDPGVLAYWFEVIENDAKKLSTEELRDKIEIKQDSVLWMKFNIKASRRTVSYIISSIEKNLSSMPFATRLYFQKVEELLQEEAFRFDLR
jgi:hypothetical protein